MATLDVLKTFPIGSLLTRPEQKDAYYLQKIKQLPPSLKKLISATVTGAFIRGLTKAYDLSLTSAPKIAFAVLQVSIGDKTLLQLPETLTQSGLPAAVTPKIAQEIEKELFAPIMLELNQYLAQREKTTAAIERPLTAQTGGAHNVLDLKTLNRPPLPPPIPKR